MTPQEDIALVRETLSGNLESFSQLIKKYKNQIFNIVFRLTRNHSETEDLCQDIFLKAYRNLNRLKGALLFKSWLYRIAVNATKNKLRYRKFIFFSLERPVLTEKGEFVPETLTNGKTPDTELAQKEAEEELNRMLECLSLKYRTVFALRYLQDLSLQEIAEITRLSQGTVKSRLFRAHQVLSKIISK